MKHGIINCECGQTFCVESVNNIVHCVRCTKEHDISGYPEIQHIEEVVFEEIQDETEGV